LPDAENEPCADPLPAGAQTAVPEAVKVPWAFPPTDKMTVPEAEAENVPVA
jgi:hypothetical protein